MTDRTISTFVPDDAIARTPEEIAAFKKWHLSMMPAYRQTAHRANLAEKERNQAREALTKIAAFVSNRPPGGPWDTIKQLALEGWPEALDIPEGDDPPLNTWVPV